MESSTSEKKHKAPGRYERRGVTIMDAVKMFDTEEKTEAWFMEQRWPNGVYCPHCGSRSVTDVKLCVYLHSTSLMGVSSMKLHWDLGIGQKAVWFLARRIRQAWDTREEPFVSPVEVDESYFGGKEANKHESKTLKAGRGAVDKTAEAGVKDRATNKVHAEVIESADTPTLTGLVATSAELGATVFTDEWRAYNPLEKMGYEHGKVRHLVGQCVDGKAHANGIESFWALLKRGYHGTYHRMSPEHQHRYVAELIGRHNQRSKDTPAQMSEVVRGGDGRQATYGELIAHSPHARRRMEELAA